MFRRSLALLAALAFVPPASAGAPTLLTIGIDRTLTPNQICIPNGSSCGAVIGTVTGGAFTVYGLGAETSRAQAAESAAQATANGKLAPTGDGSLLNVTATGGTTARTDAVRAADALNAFDKGAVCDGSTDDTAAMTALSAAGRGTIPGTLATVCKTTFSFGAVPGTRWTGPGRLQRSDGGLTAPMLSQAKNYPTSLGTFGSALSAWNGDLSAVGIAHHHIVTGAGTLGQPTSGYTQNPESSGEILSTYNSSGYNSSTSGNGGRTGLASKYFRLDQYGQGDLVSIFCSGFMGSTLAGATHYLAEPAMECLGGGLGAGATGQYIEFLGDMNITDNGYSIAGSTIVGNLKRTAADETLSQNWTGLRLQSTGTKPIEAYGSFSGPSLIGLDMTAVTMADYSLSGFSLTATGSSYTVGDLLSITTGVYETPTVYKVTSVDGGGAITGVQLMNAGLYTTAPAVSASYATVALSGGTGTGATASVTYVKGTALALPSGSCLRVGSTSNNFPNSVLMGDTSTACFANGSVTIGGRNNVTSAPTGAVNVVLGAQNQILGSGNTLAGTTAYDDAQNNALIFSSGYFSDAQVGSSQTSWRILRATTAATTACKRLSTNNSSSITSTNSYLAVSGSVHSLRMRVTAVDKTNGDVAAWSSFEGTFVRVSGATTASYAGANTTATAPSYNTGAGSTATIQIGADNSVSGAPVLSATFCPPTSNAHVWDVSLELNALKTM